MNERINQILGQAYDEAVPETWTTLSSEQLGRIYDKFAELIVQECMEQVNTHPYVGAKRTQFIYGYIQGKSDAVQQIKKHFGVES